MDDYPWPDDIYDESGQVDMERLMEILEANPDLMEQFQSMYGNGNEYPDEMAGPQSPQALEDLYTNCLQPSLLSALESIAPLLAVCMICSIVTRLTASRPFLAHILLSILGLLILYRFFQENSAIPVLYGAIACVLLLYKPLRRRMGVTLSAFTLIFVIACEFIIQPERWHNVRGAQMILSMKVISLGFDLSNESVKEVSVLETISYLLHPGSVIFGPWIPYRYYAEGLSSRRRWFDLGCLLQIVKTLGLSAVYLLCSTCVISYILPEHGSWGRWVDAYRDAQSFRFSHYFVCSLAETTLLLSGIGVFNADGDLVSSKPVSQPLNIELPRSLVEVVTSWNLPMHSWLKNYVFKVARPRWGTFCAIIITYVASSLLHGLNFQLAAVLLSLGFYSYIEHSLRHTLSEAFSMCVEARRCSSDTCSHRLGRLHVASVVLNILFMGLAMYHLAYLGVMFDTSEVEQEKGYSMLHTLHKWGNLGYSSHIVAFFTFVFYWLIK